MMFEQYMKEYVQEHADEIQEEALKGRNREKNMTKYEILKETELFVLDMDGTFYLDNDVIDGALDFLDEVKKAGKRFVFFTNNSSKDG